MRDGRLETSAGDEYITYHDSCYLARHNDVLADPRELVEAVGKPVEMKRSGKRTFCCGAGGEHMWMEERAGLINETRAREAAGHGEDGNGTFEITVVLAHGRFLWLASRRRF